MIRFPWVPWARRGHEHVVHDHPSTACAACGHLVLIHHVSTWVVEIQCQGVIAKRIFGASCAPPYSLVKMEPSGVWTAWRKTEEGGWELRQEVDCPTGWEETARRAIARAKECRE